MRLWHKDLILVLPRKQLVAQWRECCLIAKNIAENGTPNHILVNKIMSYPLNHFCYYGRLIELEMTKRGYRVKGDKFDKWLRNENYAVPYPYPTYKELFADWHNDRYLKQCYYNLEEKYDCGGIKHAEWRKIKKFVLDKNIIM